MFSNGGDEKRRNKKNRKSKELRRDGPSPVTGGYTPPCSLHALRRSFLAQLSLLRRRRRPFVQSIHQHEEGVFLYISPCVRTTTVYTPLSPGEPATF